MPQMSIEITADRQTAVSRVAALELKGYSVELPLSLSKVILRTHGVAPPFVYSLTDPDDGELWLIVGRK